MYSQKVSKSKDNIEVVHFSINGLSKAIGLDNQLDQNNPLEGPCSPLEIRGFLFSFMRTILDKIEVG